MSRTIKCVRFDDGFGKVQDYELNEYTKPMIKAVKRRLSKKFNARFEASLMIRNKVTGHVRNCPLTY